MKIAVTGVNGLLGWHAASHLHALNCAARFRSEPDSHELVLIDRACFENPALLEKSLEGVAAVLHFAGANRGPDEEIEAANPRIAAALVTACNAAGVKPHILYANSIHSERDTPYGRSKRTAGDILAAFGSSYSNLVLPHIFGERARPYYNNVTATLVDQVWRKEVPTINPGGCVSLLHAGDAVELAIDAVTNGRTGTLRPDGRDMSIVELLARLQSFHAAYTANTFPDLVDPFDLALFNTMRSGAYPTHYPFALEVRADQRGKLFETAKGGSASHTFVSTTLPGQRRGDHFHLSLCERFVVIAGEAVIRIRKVLTDEVHEFRVSGDVPVAIDQLPLHTHNIENIGSGELVTFFWSHRMFDPDAPDTYWDPV